MEKKGSQGSQAIPTRFMAAEPVEMQGGRKDQMSLEVRIYMREDLFLTGDFNHLKHSNWIEI